MIIEVARQVIVTSRCNNSRELEWKRCGTGWSPNCCKAKRVAKIDRLFERPADVESPRREGGARCAGTRKATASLAIRSIVEGYVEVCFVIIVSEGRITRKCYAVTVFSVFGIERWPWWMIGRCAGSVWFYRSFPDKVNFLS